MTSGGVRKFFQGGTQLNIITLKKIKIKDFSQIPKQTSHGLSFFRGFNT